MKTMITMLLLAFAAQAGAQTEQKETVTFKGQDFEMEGTAQTTMFGNITMRDGQIIFQGKRYKIVTSSRYGNIGAVSTEVEERGKRFLFFTSSFGEQVQGQPAMESQSYKGCEGSYNAVAVIYDVEGVNVVDSKGRVLNLMSASDVKKELFPALISNPANSKWSAGFCLTIAPVEK